MQTTQYFHCTVFGDGPTPYQLPHVAEHRIAKVRARLKETNKAARLIVQGPSQQLPSEPVKSSTKSTSPAVRPLGQVAPNLGRGGRNAGNMKAVINTTTGEYFMCTVDAARSVGAHPATISQQIAGKCLRVKGNVFRFATEAETQARKMLS